MEQRILALLIMIGTIIGGSWAVYALFETKESHDKDLLDVMEKTDLKLDNLALKIVNEMEKRHHEPRTR